MSLWLTREELQELTGYKTPRKWREELGRMNIRFRARSCDGFPLVERAQFEHSQQPKTRHREPNWAA